MNRQSTINVMLPIEIRTEEPTHRAHEFNAEFALQRCFEPMFDFITFREVAKIVNITADADRGLTWDRIPDENTRLIGAGSHAKTCHGGTKMLKPVTGRTAKSVECFSKSPIGAGLADRTTIRGFNNDDFIVG